MISVSAFLAKVEGIAAENPSYRTGGTGTDGTCDCIGLIVGAIRRAGGKWTGMKGSNYAARNEMISLDPISAVSDLRIGEAVYKAHEPGESEYDGETIRNSYASSPDKRDYYHIGVVISVSPLRIRHMTTPTVKLDTSLGKWRFHGWLKKVERGEQNGDFPGSDPSDTLPTNPTGGIVMQKAMIYGGSLTSPVNLRSSGSLKSQILCKVPQYVSVDLLESGGDWCRVSYGGKTGFVQSGFVHLVSEGNPVDVIQIPRSKLEEVYNEIGDWLGLRG